MTDKVQKQRFEYKYRISQPKALEIRKFVSKYLECDPYCIDQPGRSYTVNSLYLDSPFLKTFHDTVNGNKNRFKLRVRYYDDDEHAPVFFEIKHRYNNVIHKRRAIIYHKYSRQLLSGHGPTVNYLVNQTADQLAALQKFAHLQNQLNARPTMHVKYRREAYEKEDTNAVRVTFDRAVQTEPVSSSKLVTTLSNPREVFGDTVILELKFTNRYPDWLQEMVQRYHLRRESAAKYVDGIIRVGENNVLAA